ncbi:MAG: trans-sulfuration enzyme family protein [Nitrospinota bacterium]
MSRREPGRSTRSVHGGEAREKAESALTTPIFQTATYTFRDTAEVRDHMERRIVREEYGRYGNPTIRRAEAKFAELEGAEAALLFASGMNTITTTLFALLPRGGHLLATDDCYRRTRQFCQTFLRKLGVETTMVPAGDFEALKGSARAETRVFFTETPTNPLLRVVDLERTCAWAHGRNIKVVVDSTLATPINQKPLKLGADLVIHSATKYLGGHNDLLAGVLAGSRDLVEALRETQGVLGGILDPHSAFLLLRGSKSLALRVERQCASALRLAQFLESHPQVRRVYYPGLPSHPDHAVARRQMRGYGGLVSFEVDADGECAARAVDRLRIPFIAPSFGGVESLVEQPSLMSYYELSPEEREALGVKDELIRYSVGVEDVEDLMEDLDQALRGA